jgi:capsular exopolysaccharide synthesis family protein
VDNFRAVINQQQVKANTKVVALQKELDMQRGLAMDLNAKAAEYQQLQQDARRAQNELDMLYSRIKELSFSEETPLSISVLEVARPQGLPVKPRIPQTAGIALVIGLMLGLGGALLQDWMDQRLRSVEEIRAVLDLPVLGIVPIMPGKHAPSERGQEVHLRPRSTVAEAYRTVRTALYFGLADPTRCKTILVTSPSPGDGKTTMASNLAIAIAQSGRKVLLIDADTRKPMMHRIFNLGDEVGLSSVLLGQATTAEAIQKTHADGLDIMPCGPIPPNPSEILNSQTFLDTVDALCSQYDQIVIDSPPVEPVTDSRILAASCDVTLLVLRAEKSTRRLSAHARDALIGVGANLLGVIVNAVPRGQDGYSYYSGYGYYRYGYGRNNENGNGGSANGNGNGNGHKEIKAITVAGAVNE